MNRISAIVSLILAVAAALVGFNQYQLATMQARMDAEVANLHLRIEDRVRRDQQIYEYAGKIDDSVTATSLHSAALIERVNNLGERLRALESQQRGWYNRKAPGGALNNPP